MTKDCSTCIHKEGSCYPSTTIFDKDKTCKSYDLDYEGYITELEKENAELKDKVGKYQIGMSNEIEKRDVKLTKAKELLREIIDTPVFNQMGGNLYENEGYVELVEEVEHFLSEVR